MEPVIILGMARSGTTYLAKELDKAGINMFDWEITHMEDADLWGWNSAELVANPPDESTVPYTYEPSAKLVERLEWYRGMRDKQGGAWGFKEPRVARMFKAYIKVFPQATYICCIRNSLSCVWSQMNRVVKAQGVSDTRMFIPFTMRAAHVAILALENNLDLVWFNYDGDMKDNSDLLSNKLGVELHLEETFKWKQAGRSERYQPDDTAPLVPVERELDMHKINKD